MYEYKTQIQSAWLTSASCPILSLGHMVCDAISGKYIVFVLTTNEIDFI